MVRIGLVVVLVLTCSIALAAPPGDPRPVTDSSNHSALIGVNCFHSAGTSSS